MKATYPIRLLDQNDQLPERAIVLERFRRLVIDGTDITEPSHEEPAAPADEPDVEVPADEPEAEADAPADEPEAEAEAEPPADAPEAEAEAEPPADEPQAFVEDDPEAAADEPEGDEPAEEPEADGTEDVSPERRARAEAPTIVSMNVAEIMAAADDEPEPESESRAEPEPEAHADRYDSEAPTIMEMSSDAIIAAAMAAEAAKEVASDDPSSEGGSDGRKVSETAWFMAAVSPEAMEDGAVTDFDDQDRRTESYSKKEELPDAVRKGFSLEVEE